MIKKSTALITTLGSVTISGLRHMQPACEELLVRMNNLPVTRAGCAGPGQIVARQFVLLTATKSYKLQATSPKPQATSHKRLRHFVARHYIP